MKYLNFDGLSHFLSKLSGVFSVVGHTHTKSEITDYVVDSAMSSTSTNPVQNQVVNTALSGKVSTSRKINGKALTADVTLSASDVGADAIGTAETKASEALEEAKSYTNTKVAELVDSAPATLDTLAEVAAAIQENETVVEALNSAIGNKVDKVSGKTLSTNDFTDEYREKLDSISSGANSYTLPAATASDLGGVKIGSNITNNSGTISITHDNVVSALGFTPGSGDGYEVATETTDGLMSKEDRIVMNRVITVSSNDTSIPAEPTPVNADTLNGMTYEQLSSNLKERIKDGLSFDAAPVQSVNGKTGAVVLSASDVGAVSSDEIANMVMLESDETDVEGDAPAVNAETFSGMTYEQVKNDVNASAPVQSVNGKTDAVELDYSDVGAASASHTHTGMYTTSNLSFSLSGTTLTITKS